MKKYLKLWAKHKAETLLDDLLDHLVHKPEYLYIVNSCYYNNMLVKSKSDALAYAFIELGFRCSVSWHLTNSETNYGTYSVSIYSPNKEG